MISCWEAGAVPVESCEVLWWRSAGHEVPMTLVPVTNWKGDEILQPAITIEVADRLARAIDDETTRQMLAAAVTDAREYLGIIGRRCAACGTTGQRHYFVNTGSETLCVDCG